MVQPGNPYQNPGSAGQPWGQQPPQPPAWSPPGPPAPDPWQSPPASVPPVPVWPGPQQGFLPPPPPKSNSGLVVALIGGAVVLLLVAVIGAILLFRGEDEGPVAEPTPSVSLSDSPSYSPTPDLPDPESLDSADTDETSLTTDAIFPDRTFTGDNGQTYTLAGTLKTNACSGAGGDPVKKLLNRYDCGRMVVGVWLNADEDLFSALLVIPLDSDEDAEALHSDIVADKQDVINGLTYYCPSDGKPGAKLCKRSADNLPTWYASFTTFHRYLFIAISLYTDGHRAQSMSEVDAFTTETVSYVSNVMLGED